MAREFPIHNGRMTTDLDANGHRIKNLPPGSGFTQVQADWGQTDTTAPDFIKNKPTLAAVATSGSYDDLLGKPTIPAPVAVDATLAAQGAAADAKAVGDALRSGFTEWVVVPSTYGGESLRLAWSSAHSRWKLYLGGRIVGEKVVGHDVTSITFDYPEDTDIDVAVTATRHLVTPTKTSQLTNDGDGTNAFVKTDDARLSDARTPTAHAHAVSDVTGLGAALVGKADKSVPSAAGNLAALDAQGNLADSGAKASDFAAKTDLPYALVTPGEWEFSGSGYDPTKTYYVGTVSVGTEYYYELDIDGVYTAESDTRPSDDALVVEFASEHITATRPSLPGHLCDRSVNAVSVTDTTTLTLPALANAGKARDFLVRLAISGSTVPTITFAAPTGETITYETDGDEFPVPDEAGDWLYSFTETAAHKFAVSLKKVNTVAQGGS